MHLCLSTTKKHLEGILRLQQKYLKKNLSANVIASQGFLTVEHRLDLLTEMNRLQKHIIAVDQDRVVGYALSMSSSLQNKLPLLEPMFRKLKSTTYSGQSLEKSSYYIMGQICIDEQYRGAGLFRKLYEEHRKWYAKHFDYLITEVSDLNTRSLRAHEKIGFQTLEKYRDATDLWHLILWDWNQNLK